MRRFDVAVVVLVAWGLLCDVRRVDRRVTSTGGCWLRRLLRRLDHRQVADRARSQACNWCARDGLAVVARVVEVAGEYSTRGFCFTKRPLLWKAFWRC